jgi:hypothetical protein
MPQAVVSPVLPSAVFCYGLEVLPKTQVLKGLVSSLSDIGSNFWGWLVEVITLGVCSCMGYQNASPFLSLSLFPGGHI